MAIFLPPLTSESGATPAAATPLPPGAVDKNMFMKLLVAQLRNQDPMKPSDGMQFVAELAQFQQLEQTVNAGQDLAAIRADLDLIAHPDSQS